MNIYIMSRGRAGRVNTLKWIPEAWKERTHIICSYPDFKAYMDVYGADWYIDSAPERVTNYSQKLQWIKDGLPTYFPANGSECLSYAQNMDTDSKCLIMDDDLVFSQRQGLKLLSTKDPEELPAMYAQIEEMLNTYALVGVHPRQMGQHARSPFVVNGRIICMQGINRELVGKVKVDQFPILADVILNCTLLARGQANAILTTFFQDHGPCQAAGGCSIYRTPAMQREAVEYLAARFPSYVKVVERRTKDQWLAENGVRVDYTCQWKQLYKAGVAWKEGRGPSPDKEVAS